MVCGSNKVWVEDGSDAAGRLSSLHEGKGPGGVWVCLLHRTSFDVINRALVGCGAGPPWLALMSPL